MHPPRVFRYSPDGRCQAAPNLPAATLVSAVGFAPLAGTSHNWPAQVARMVLEFHQRATTQPVLFVTPEYNRSVPAPLKNAIDVGSRPYGKSVWDGKPGAVISVAPVVIGAFGANHHLRQSLVFLNVPCLQMPEAYIGDIAKRFDAEGALSDVSTREFLQKFMSAYAEWVERNAK